VTPVLKTRRAIPGDAVLGCTTALAAALSTLPSFWRNALLFAIEAGCVWLEVVEYVPEQP